MIVVGLETSSATAGIAVIRDQQVIADATLEIGAVYAEQLPGILDRTMGDLSLQWSEVEGFAISIGPGSYTGLRVGLSLVKGLAYVTKRPVAAVPTLECRRLPSTLLPVSRPRAGGCPKGTGLRGQVRYGGWAAEADYRLQGRYPRRRGRDHRRYGTADRQWHRRLPITHCRRTRRPSPLRATGHRTPDGFVDRVHGYGEPAEG